MPHYYWKVTPGTVNNVPVPGTSVEHEYAGAGYIVLAYNGTSNTSSLSVMSSVPNNTSTMCYVSIGRLNYTSKTVEPHNNGSLTITMSGNLWDVYGPAASNMP